MNSIALVLERQAQGESSAVRILIDGRDLLDLVRKIELPQAAAGGRPELAGTYQVLHPSRWEQVTDEDDCLAIFGCDCGEVGCWPLLVRITRGAHEVRWSDFHQPYREWSYAALGPFRFVADDYDRVVNCAQDQL